MRVRTSARSTPYNCSSLRYLLHTFAGVCIVLLPVVYSFTGPGEPVGYPHVKKCFVRVSRRRRRVVGGHRVTQSALTAIVRYQSYVWGTAGSDEGWGSVL